MAAEIEEAVAFAEEAEAEDVEDLLRYVLSPTSSALSFSGDDTAPSGEGQKPAGS